MASTKIAFINQSSLVDDTEAKKVMSALNRQVKEHYAPIWGTDADLEFFKRNQKPPKGYWWLVILDNSDDATALGYHDLTDEGMPMGKIFAKTDKINKSSWTVTASHELLEMMEDPGINLMVYRLNESQEAYLYSYEVCDACEADKYGYRIDGVLVSDFVYPGWFEDFDHPSGTIYDYRKKIKKPFQLLDQGYIDVNKLDTSDGWSQLYGNEKARQYKMRPHVGSRRERRRTMRSEWMISKPNNTKPGSV